MAPKKGAKKIAGAAKPSAKPKPKKKKKTSRGK